MRHLLFYYRIMTIMILISCSQKQDKKVYSPKSMNFFDARVIRENIKPDTLKIETRFSECGEWGGHQEHIIITSDKDKRFYATYKIFPFNCDSLDFYYGKKNLASILNKTIQLNQTTKKSILDYLQRLTLSNNEQKIIGHAGNIFKVFNSDSTINIQVYNMNNSYVKSYEQLIIELMNKNYR